MSALAPIGVSCESTADDPLGTCCKANVPCTVNCFLKRGAGPLFSRAPETHFLGKCNASMEVSLPESMKEDISAIARTMDPPMTGAELVRTVMSDFLYGRMAQVRRILNR